VDRAARPADHEPVDLPKEFKLEYEGVKQKHAFYFKMLKLKKGTGRDNKRTRVLVKGLLVVL